MRRRRLVRPVAAGAIAAIGVIVGTIRMGVGSAGIAVQKIETTIEAFGTEGDGGVDAVSLSIPMPLPMLQDIHHSRSGIWRTLSVPQPNRVSSGARVCQSS